MTDKKRPVKRTKRKIPAKPRKLTEQQRLFCEQYVIDCNGKQAAIRAGYSPRCAEVQASRLLTNAKVQEYVGFLRQKLTERTQIDAAYVLESLHTIAERCMQNIRPVVDGFGKQQYDDEGNALFTFDARNAISALEKIGKHVDVQAFKERMDDDSGLTIITFAEDRNITDAEVIEHQTYEKDGGIK